MTTTGTTTATALDMDKLNAFAMKVVGDVTQTSIGALSVIGDRLGLFETLGASGPLTSEQFASKAGIAERYAREWLSAMACNHYVSYDNTTKQFSLTPEQAFVLANPDSPVYLSSLFVMSQPFWANIDRLTTAFQQGGGVAQEHYGDQFWCGFERFTRPAFLNSLCQDWIPAMPDIDARLRAGGSVADVGCGNGQGMLFLARGYPSATVVGYDNYPPAIAAANANAQKEGLGGRVRYETLDVTQGIPATYDLITCFDVVHDMAQPRAALTAIRKALKPGGAFFVLEFNFSGDLQENLDHPMGIGAFGYAASTNYCMTTALAVGGEGTGTCMGEAKMREYAKDAGFTQVQRIDFPNNPFNIAYVLRA